VELPEPWARGVNLMVILGVWELIVQKSSDLDHGKVI